MGLGNFGGPGLHRTTINFHCATTVGAHQVMVVPFIMTLAVEGFTTGDSQNINSTDLRQGLESAVDRGLSDGMLP